jgi:hypothetical protein
MTAQDGRHSTANASNSHTSEGNEKENEMKIAKILSEHGNDFSAEMECEHCGHKMTLTNGYHDSYYHTRIIPGMYCRACRKNRAGELEHTDAE